MIISQISSRYPCFFFKNKINFRLDKIGLKLSCWIGYFMYRTRAIITRSRFETALDYKPQILNSKNEELPLFST